MHLFTAFNLPPQAVDPFHSCEAFPSLPQMEAFDTKSTKCCVPFTCRNWNICAYNNLKFYIVSIFMQGEKFKMKNIRDVYNKW